MSLRAFRYIQHDSDEVPNHLADYCLKVNAFRPGLVKLLEFPQLTVSTPSVHKHADVRHNDGTESLCVLGVPRGSHPILGRAHASVPMFAKTFIPLGGARPPHHVSAPCRCLHPVVVCTLSLSGVCGGGGRVACRITLLCGGPATPDRHVTCLHPVVVCNPCRCQHPVVVRSLRAELHFCAQGPRPTATFS